MQWILKCSGIGLGALALAVVAHAGEVWVVAPSGGDFTTIQAAVNAASDGDIVLVRPAASYPAFHVSGRSLAIVSSNATVRTILGEVRLEAVPAGGLCTLSFLSAKGAASGASGVSLSSCEGAVRLQSCNAVSNSIGNGLYVPHSPGLRVESCSQTALFAVQAAGGSYSTQSVPTPGGHGLVSSNSTVHVLGGQFSGGKGGQGDSDDGDDGGAGGHGILVDGGLLSALGAGCRGGQGGHGEMSDSEVLGCPPGGNGGPGGHGVQVQGLAGSQATLRYEACLFLGGAGGGGAISLCGGPMGSPGSAGQPTKALGLTSLVDLGPVVRYLTASTIVRENQALQLVARGAAGDQVWVRVERFAPIAGSRAVPQLAKPIFLGTIPASSVLAVTWPVSELGPGVEGRIVRLSPTFKDPSGSNFSAPDFVSVLVDSGF